MSTVYFHGGRQEASRVVRALVASLLGKSAPGQAAELARGVFFSIGFAALSDIQGDFVNKSRGGTGADGETWPPLSEKYLAYGRRFGPGERTALKASAGLGRQHAYAPGGKDGLLSKAELRRWRGIYAHLLARFAVDMPLGEAKAKAAAIAWNRLKASGAKTKLEVFGHREVDILRDTSVLLNSLSMGRLVGSEYAKPAGDGGEQQIFEPLANGIAVGTRVIYARTHNEGDPKRGIPKRQFIPPSNKIPAAWLSRWADVGMQAVAHAVSIQLGRAG